MKKTLITIITFVLVFNHLLAASAEKKNKEKLEEATSTVLFEKEKYQADLEEMRIISENIRTIEDAVAMTEFCTEGPDEAMQAREERAELENQATSGDGGVVGQLK